MVNFCTTYLEHLVNMVPWAFIHKAIGNTAFDIRQAVTFLRSPKALKGNCVLSSTGHLGPLKRGTVYTLEEHTHCVFRQNSSAQPPPPPLIRPS